METSWEAFSKQAIGTRKTMWGNFAWEGCNWWCPQALSGVWSGALPCTLSAADPKPALEAPAAGITLCQQGPGQRSEYDPHSLKILYFVFFFNLLQILSPVFFPSYSFDLFFFFFYLKGAISWWFCTLWDIYFIIFSCSKFSRKEKRFLALSICVKITWSYGF